MYSTRYFGLLLLINLMMIMSCQEQKSPLLPLVQEGLKANQKTVTLKMNNYCLNASMEASGFFAINMSMKVEDGGAYIDFDRDGIPNYRDEGIALNIALDDGDSNDDGYSDLMIFLAGISAPEQVHLQSKCEDHTADSDHDGLTDCEETLLKTSLVNFDTDGDGIPDYLEVRFGLDPLDAIDASLDTDGDGVNNFNEVKANTPVDESNHNGIIKALEMKYDTFQTTTLPQVCYSYQISNVSIVASSNANMIRLYFIEKQKTNLNNTTLKIINLQIDPSVLSHATLEFNFDDY